MPPAHTHFSWAFSPRTAIRGWIALLSEAQRDVRHPTLREEQQLPGCHSDAGIEHPCSAEYHFIVIGTIRRGWLLFPHPAWSERRAGPHLSWGAAARDCSCLRRWRGSSIRAIGAQARVHEDWNAERMPEWSQSA